MSTGTVSVHSWNDSVEIPSESPYTTTSPSHEAPTHPGYFDIDDGGVPEMGSSYNAKLLPTETFKRSRVGHDRAWGRQQGRGLRSNPVRPVRYGVDGEGEGW